jgi:flagellar biosynthesis protein FlhF
LYNQLIRQGVEAGMVKRVCQLSADTLGYQTAMNDKKLVEYLRRQLEAYIKVQREPSHKEHQIICMVGSSGSGKTSLSAKLAVRYRKELKRSVAWVCADTVRTGGIAEAKAFTEAINIPMQVAYTPQECSAIIDSFYGNDLIIVDTAACNPRSEESLVETGALLTAIPDRTTWIVVSATTKENDIMNAAGAFSIFRPRALVVSKMDETNSFGTVYNLGLRTQLPFAYFSCGARVMDDLVPAAASRLVQSLFTERFDR